MRLIALLTGILLFGGVTGAAYLASARGWGLSGMLEQPVSIRQHSVSGGRQGGKLLYFGIRRHHGGGFRGGK